MAAATAEEDEHTTTTSMITKWMGRDVRQASWVLLSPDKFYTFSVLYRDAFYDVEVSTYWMGFCITTIGTGNR